MLLQPCIICVLVHLVTALVYGVQVSIAEVPAFVTGTLVLLVLFPGWELVRGSLRGGSHEGSLLVIAKFT